MPIREDKKVKKNYSGIGEKAKISDFSHKVNMYCSIRYLLYKYVLRLE